MLDKIFVPTSFETENIWQGFLSQWYNLIALKTHINKFNGCNECIGVNTIGEFSKPMYRIQMFALKVSFLIIKYEIQWRQRSEHKNNYNHNNKNKKIIIWLNDVTY